MFVCEGEQNRMEEKKCSWVSEDRLKKDSAAKVDIYGTEEVFFFFFIRLPESPGSEIVVTRS